MTTATMALTELAEMPRYKHIDTSPRFLSVDLEAQLLPGTFEHALNHLLDHEIDLSGFDARFNNDEVGASAFPPAMRLKVVLLAYSRGIVSSRAIERACRSGTRADFVHQARKMEAAVTTMLARHRDADTGDAEPSLQARKVERIERLQHDAYRIREWLAENPEDRKGSRGAVRKSNRTDNESAKMATSKGVIQGYTGVAAVDSKHQVIVEAQAHGTGSEQELLLPTVAALGPVLAADTLITADAGYHSEANLAALAQMKREALIPDNGMRSRDERFDDSAKYKQEPDPLHDKSPAKKASPLYGPQDFKFDRDAHSCVCPAGQELYGSDRRAGVRQPAAQQATQSLHVARALEGRRTVEALPSASSVLRMALRRSRAYDIR